MRIFHVVLMMAAFLLVPGGRAWAQGAFGGGAPHIAASLIAESERPRSGEDVMLAIVMEPEAGWHGYWQNPGDAGKGMEVAWRLPAAMQAGELRYPVPEKLVIAGLMNHVYEGPHAVLVKLRVPAGLAPGTRLPVRATAQWLACTAEICVPQSGELALDMTVGDGAVTAERRTRFDRYLAALPQPLAGQAHFAVTGARLRMAIPYPSGAAIEAPWFFRLTQGATSYAAPQSFSRTGDMLILETAASGPVPARLEGVLGIGPHRGLSVTATAGMVPAAGTPVGAPSARGGWRAVLLALGGALLGGLLLNIMPCVFPILSLKALSLARAGGAEREVRIEALAYAAGVVATSLALGAVLLALRAGGEQIGWAFQLQSPPVILALCLVAWLICLNLAGLFHFDAIDAGDDLTRKGGTHGAFWTGALVAFVATPCTGPFMAAALGAALVLPVGAALAIFAGLGLGLALPFLVIAYVPALRNRLPRPGPWMRKLQLFLALPMLATVAALVWLIWRQAGQGGLGIALGLLVLAAPLLWLYGLMQRKGARAVRATGLGVLLLLALGWAAGAAMLPVGGAPARGVLAVGDTRFDEPALAAARAGGRPVFLYFTADWCLSCKVNEAAAIDREEVRAAWKEAGVMVMVGDWTNGDPAIGRFLEAHGRSGVPLYLWYPKGGGEPVELPQLLTPDMLTGLAAGKGG